MFAAEAVVQLVGSHPRQYFTDAFNTFDIFLVLASLSTIALEQTIKNAQLGFRVCVCVCMYA